MSELTLPGDIPGLLRRGSPVVFRSGGHVPGTVAKFADHKGITDVPWVWWEPHNEPNGVGKPSLRNSILLDLSDPTGRAHAAWWVLGQSAGPVSKALAALDTSSTYLLGLIDRCCAGSATAFDTEALRRIVLHVAGREGSDV